MARAGTEPRGAAPNAIKSTARLAGLLYVAMSILMVFGYMVVPNAYIVSGDAAATARRIGDGMLLYRLGILDSLIAQILFIFVVLTLYRLFKDVDRGLARLMVTLVCVGVAAEIVNLAHRVAPLLLLSGADFLSVFTRSELEALAYVFLRLGHHLGQLVQALWALWLFPFGILTIRSGYFPKFLGILLFLSGAAYAVTCIASIVHPASRPAVSQLMTPLYFGELGMVLWLAIMGAKVPCVEARPAQVS